MVGVDLMDQVKSAYQLDRRRKFRCSMLLLSILLYKKLENKDLTVKEFKICIALKLIAFFVSRKLSCPNHRPSKRTKVQRPGAIPPSHLPIFLEVTRRCTVCCQAGKESRTFVTCSLCDIALCLQKERNYFLQYHSQASSNLYS